MAFRKSQKTSRRKQTNMKNKSYLQQLKELVSSAFEGAESKEDIDRCSQIEQAIKGVEGEQSDLMEKNKELIAAYKDAVMHPGISEKRDSEPTDMPAAKSVSFEDFIASQIH